MNVPLFVIAAGVGTTTFLIGGMLDTRFPAGRTAHDPGFAGARKRIRRRLVIGGVAASILLAVVAAMTIRG